MSLAIFAAMTALALAVLLTPLLRSDSRPQHLNLMIAGVIFLVFVIGAGGMYSYLGSPGVKDQPFEARSNDPDMQIDALAQILAAELVDRPDAAGYRKLGAMQYALQRFGQSASAYQKATELDKTNAETWAQLGESLVMANDGAVMMEAQSAFKKSLTIDPRQPRAQFFMGLAETQIGNLRKGVAIWRALAATAPADAPWLPTVDKDIVAYAKLGSFDPSSVAPAPFR